MFGPKPDLIYHLVYSNLYRSILFDDRTFADWKIECHNMEHSLLRITQAFGSNMTYDGVVYALTQLNSDTILNSGLEILLNNSNLGRPVRE